MPDTLSSLVDWFTSLGETFDSEDNKRMRNTTIDVRIDFPALDSLVAYLKEREATQAQVDAMAAKVTELTNRLQSSGTGLDETVKDSK